MHVQGKSAEAVLIYRDILATQERLLGRDHADTLCTLGNLGGILNDGAILAEVHVACQRVFGPQHPRTLAAADNVRCHSPSEAIRRAPIRASTHRA